MSKGSLKREDDRDRPSLAERALMVTSLVVTLTLFGYAVYQAVTAPAEPELTVTVVGTEAHAEAVHVHVEVRNEGGEGFLTVTVEVTCDRPAPTVTFENLAANDARQATLVCPVDTVDAEARLVAMVPA